MDSQSSYERIEYYLGELRAQARSDAPAQSPEAAQHVQALLALFQETLQQLTRATVKPG